MHIKEHYQCKNQKASILVNLKESEMSNAMNEDVGLPSKSSFVPPDASTSKKNIGEGPASSKCSGFPTLNRPRQTSLDESFQSTLLEDAQLALAKAIFFSGVPCQWWTICIGDQRGKRSESLVLVLHPHLIM